MRNGDPKNKPTITNEPLKMENLLKMASERKLIMEGTSNLLSYIRLEQLIYYW